MATLLLLDRCRRTRREAYRLLRERHEVFATHNIFTTFKELRRRPVDLIVVRTADRDASAVALLKWMSLRGRAIPTVVVLGPGSLRDAELVRRLGASAILRPPITAKRLLAAVRSVDTSGARYRTRQFSRALPARHERVRQLAGLN